MSAAAGCKTKYLTTTTIKLSIKAPLIPDIGFSPKVECQDYSILGSY
jgi:hypothetical protein